MSNPAYFVFDVTIHDPAGMQPYQAQVQQTLVPYGGTRLVLGGALDTIEGTGPHGKIIILQFPSVELAHAWHDSPAYQAIVPHRLASATTHAYLVEGIAA